MVATGCSSSLLAVHLACQGLLSRDCEMAIAGGITLDLLPISTKTDIWNQLGITGPNVKCRAFDASATGIAKGEGCGVVLLKPLSTALSDGDHIYGVLEATTANQDGHSNGITAPHPGAQAHLLCQAWKLANITPKSLDYFEAHGTGTELGDPIEISGITTAFKMFGVTYNGGIEGKIPIGSVKANIGHLADGGAGVVALIKALLCLQKNTIPPAVNFSEPNPHINWQAAPVYVNTNPLDWKPNEDNSPRFASVSAFGLLGTNVHAVIREHVPEAVPVQPSVTRSAPTLLALAANSKQSLLAFVAKMAKFLSNSEDRTTTLLKNICYTVNTGREQVRFKHRAVVYANTWDRMVHLLEKFPKVLSEETFGDDMKYISFSRHAAGYCISYKSGQDEATYLSDELNAVATAFLVEKNVSWKTFYSGTNVKKVPLIPTYAFDRVRYWPKLGKAINKELLQLEHKLEQHITPAANALKRTEDTTVEVKVSKTEPASSYPVEKILQEALNEALGTNYDWNEIQNQNLFALGVDSLICTQLCVKLQDEMDCSFSMADFHNNPTFAGIEALIKKKVASKMESCSNTQLSVVVSSVLKEALNDALGKNYDWEQLEHENLFTLGVDSLMYTLISIKLNDTLSLAAPLTMTELHGNPSYSGLCEVIAAKVNLPKSISSDTSNSANISTEYAANLFPMSFAQKRLWTIQEITTNACAYNATNCLKITGNFHPAAFVMSANMVLSRHGAFYTVFIDSQSGPMQTHNWKLQVCIQESDLQSYGDEAEEYVMMLYDEDYKTPFNLKQGPLVRCKLYHLPNNEYYFTMVVHHIIFDGWSHFIFYNELWDSYVKLSEGKRVSPTLHKPLYVEFAKEEQTHTESFRLKIDNDLSYWKNKLSGSLPLTTLPGDKRRPPVFTHKGKRITHFISHDIIKSLQQFATSQHTMFMTLLATVYVLIYHYTGEKDLVIGTPIAGRYRQAAKHVIGCFVNTLALRVQLEEYFSFNDILESVSKVCLEAYDHQMAPFDHLVSLLNLPRETSITPVFSVNVCYHNTEIRAEHVTPPSEVKVERKLLHNDSSKWDLYFDFLQEPDGMRFTLEYYSDLFSDSYAHCVMKNYLTILESVSQNPYVTLSKLNLTKMIPQLQLSVVHGATRRLGDTALPALLLKSLQLHAKVSFIVDVNGASSDYGELLARAERLAVFLREFCKLPKHSRVGILLDNSIEALDCILACVFSGLVYVPLDSFSPRARLKHICNEAEIKLLVFSKSHLALANHLQWASSSIMIAFCVDAKNYEDLQEDVLKAPLMDIELWDCVASEAENDIEGGGWKSSYTGEHMSAEEMNEYTENVFKKLKKYLKPASRILEIGCASGLTTRRLCQFVDHYVATDLSLSMTERLEKKLQEEGISNVEVICVPADHVSHKFQGQAFDVIIMNSVVHCFPGHSYLRKVLSACESVLSENGVIFIGDIMDLDLKDKLVASLKAFKNIHPQHRVKTEWHNELFLSRKFIQYLCASSETLKSVSCSRKFYTIPNELTEFRFDVIFTKSPCTHDVLESLTEKMKYKTCAISDATRAIEGKYDRANMIITRWANDIELKDEMYILYTSGTTGVPKGVIINHEAILNYVTWAAAAYKFNTKTTMPLFSPLTFDFTLTAIFPPLLSGSTVCIYKSFQESHMDIASCKQMTTVKLSPLQLDTILSTTEESLNASTFIIGGEELTSTLLTKLKKNKLHDSFVVWNEYGPTEATVGCVVKCFTSEELPLASTELVSIGQPIDNVTIAVVRDNFEPVPIGGKGTLSIGGKCLCLDFAGTGESKEANRRKSFSPACWGRPGEQMLLTDDVVEVIPATCELAYFGREKDCNTTKVNGIRIDLMEVQHAIESSHLIHSAWVCSFLHENHTCLGAAVKLKPTLQGESCSGKTWKQLLTSFLAQSLPTRYIPNVFIVVSDPPTNVNGKKDVPFLQRLFTAEMYANTDKHCSSMQGSNSMVNKLQIIWQSILPIHHLPHPDEDFFFDLSGDSLQAIHLVRKMRDEGFHVSVTDIFQNPTIEKLMVALQENSHISSIKPFPSHPEENFKFKPTPILEEYFSRSRSSKYLDHFALSALLCFHDKLEANILNKALRAIMMKHVSLRSRFEISNGTVLQQVTQLSPDVPKVIEVNIVRKHEQLSNEPQFLELCQQLEESHSLSEGILVSAGIINADTNELDNGQFYALLVVHHAAIDIVSWQQILEDLAAVLRLLSEDQSTEPVLQQCILPFPSFCAALHTEASTGVFISEIDYWNDIEKQCMESGKLNLIKDGQQGCFKSAKWFSKSIDARCLRSIANKLGSPNEHILLTAFGRSISSIHGQDKTAICLESHGRQLTSVDSTDTVGWCTSRFPFVLETPSTADLLAQVKLVGKEICKIPNHGLGFGSLKSGTKLKMSYPKIMFVFQGSLDASSKKTFDGGKFKFDYIPWIEIMLNELRQGRFHRHPEDVLEFDLEIIAWIHGGELKFGCLYDKDVISEFLVEDIVKRAHMNLEAMAKQTHGNAKEIKVEVISSFIITPDCVQTVSDALWHHNICTNAIRVQPPEQVLQSLYSAEEEAADVTVIIPRHKTDDQAMEFVKGYNQSKKLRKGTILVIINAETITNSVKLPVDLLQVNDNVVLLPEDITSSFYDGNSDVEYSMPFTQDGYTYLGLTIARTIRSTICHSKYKVIAVDADYTLWNGECAEESVTFHQANIYLHKFLLKMKTQGMLLVILSKNNRQDVENVFEIQQEDMVLKKDDFIAIIANWKHKHENIRYVSQLLNLGLDTFVFIDDNPLECEEMIHSLPEVLTLQFSSTEELLVPPLLDNLWMLDTFSVTSESAARTEMYRNEFIRHEEMKSLVNIDATSRSEQLTNILSHWNMKMTICKTPLTSLKQNKKIYGRATELLHRTNQFKLNNVHTKLNEVKDEEICWIVLLEDRHGSYGIVSVALLSQNTDCCSQWVLSCRALGRKVEHRILYELCKEGKNSASLQLIVNETGHNAPAIAFLQSLSVQSDISGINLIHIPLEVAHLPNVAENLHEVESVDLKCLEEKLQVCTDSRIVDDRWHIVKATSTSEPISPLREVSLWIQRRWSPSQKEQALHHSMFPIIPTCKYLTKCDAIFGDQGHSSREHDLKTAWMEVLQSNKEPKASDNFLKHGGSSFSAVFLVSKLQRCKIDINVMDVLQNPKYSDLQNVVLHASTITEETCQEKKLNDKCYPLSAAQQRMVVMQQTVPNSTAYVETVACHTRNRIKPAEIFKALVEQHLILTAKIEMDSESELCVMTTNGEFNFSVRPEIIEKIETAEKYLTESIPVIKISVDAPSADLAKFRHLNAGDITVLVVHMHHLISDEITLSNISRDLQNLMSGLPKTTELPEQSYAFYVDIEKQYLKSSQFEEDSQFWREKLLVLPSDCNLSILPKVESEWNDTKVYKAKHSSQLIPTVTVKKIIGFCNALGITDFQYYLACTAVVLQRYLGVNEVTFAVPVTTRTDIHQYTDGLFVNTVLFKVAVDLSMTFQQYVKAVGENWLKTLCHSQYPLDQVTKMVWKEHGKSVNTFCNVMFNYTIQNQSESELRVYSRHAKMPLSLDIICDTEKKKGEVLAEWATELIDDDIAKRLADSVIKMYCGAVANADCKLHNIESLSPHEYELLRAFNPHSVEPHLKSRTPIHRTFEKYAAMNPRAQAVFCNGNFLSYGQLNEIASRIAYGLRQKIDQAALKSKPVVIVMKKDEYAIASILGIWKAGGHFLPISLQTQSCLKDVLERCTPAAVLSNITLEPIQLSGNRNCPLLSTEDVIKCSLESCKSGEIPDMEITESTLAYIIRTSGSTGRPKQCKISHSSLIIIANAWTEKYRMNDFTVNVLQWAPLSFDVFVGDVVRGLICAPGQLTICPDRFRLDVSYILNLIKDHKITMAEVTPQFGLQLVENDSGRDLESLKLFILGSDMLQYHLYGKVKDFLNRDQRLINSYGMTEATIDSSFFEGESPRTRSGTVPIGKPLPGVDIYILDARTLQPCPVGTVGEMYIGGPVIASGDVEIVELKHLHCWGLKTGDAACWLPSGDIELMGRLDSMVKLRGFRISTTEIENKIVELVKGVKDARVVPLTNDDGLEFLCAFLVLNVNINKSAVNRHAVCNQLKGELSYYMLPDFVHILDRIPLTTHGKVDHKALPNATQLLENEVVKDGEISTHTSSTVSTLVELFAKALGIPDSSKIHCELTFMEQGGHSLSLVRFASLIRQKSTFKIEIADLFSYPSIFSLAGFIDDKKANKTELYEFQQVADEPVKQEEKHSEDQDIAITGLGLRLPGGIMSLPELWEVLDKGNDLIRDFPDTRANDVLNCLSSSTAKTLSNTDTFQGAFLEQINQFDNQFFKIAPGEAKFMSPEQRLFLQVATEALAEGTKLSQVKGAKIGVFVANSDIGYSQLNHPDEAICISGLMPGMIATRVAYQWDLKGPTMLVDTACSSSLVALKQACESIKRNECDGALVGGVSLVLYPARTGVFGQTSILSPDFCCKAFDKDASGTAVGEGILCLYVEPLSKALKERKPVYGVLKSITLNSVGHGNGITAPTATSQQKVIQEALIAAKVRPSDITFLECHGTGTVLGDKIELSALGRVFEEYKPCDRRLPIGSIKSMFGHLDSAAGLLGLFKVLASLMTKQIAPTAHFKAPHPELVDSRFYVPSKTLPWEASESNTRIAGVSSFGLTGTNCHVIVAELRGSESIDQVTGCFPLLFSGNSMEQIQKQASLYKTLIQQSVLKTSRNTLPGICLSVAQRLKELAEVKAGHNQWHMVILANDAMQVLKVVDIINSTNDADTLIQLASLRSDVYMYCPQYTENKCASTGIQSYLVDGRIDLKDLFNGKHCCIRGASEVTIAMYDESRHWLDSTSAGIVKNYSESLNVLDLLRSELGKTREVVRTLQLGPTQDLRETQGKFCAAIIIKFFLRTDVKEYVEKSKEITFAKAFSLSNMLSKYEKFFFVMIRELLQNNLVQATGIDETIHCLDSFKFQCEHFLSIDPHVIANHAVEKYPAWADCFRFPLYCSKSLLEVLQGEKSPLTVIYPQGDLNFMNQFDKLGDLLGDVYYNMYMQIIATYARQLSSQGKNVRVLEVGAGVGHVTRQLLPKLKDTPNIEYWFTDLGKAFVEHAKTLFSDYLYMMKFSVFDITKSAPKQGVLGSFDIVISYNVIHTTESVKASVRNLKSCLGNDGTLFIVESAKNETWATLAWGILDGWWYFKDYDLRPTEPMMEPEKWETVLTELGFASVHSCPVDEYEKSHVEKFLFLCSTKTLTNSNLPNFGWWETDVHRFDPIKQFTDPQDEENDTTSTADLLIDGQRIYLELKNIWSELLGIDTASILPEDDFNSLGGESLLAIQMIKLVHKRIGYQLEIADTFGFPTLGALAEFITDRMDEHSKNVGLDPRPSGVSSSFFCPTVDGSLPTNSYNRDTNEPKSEVARKATALINEQEEQGTLLMFPGQGAQKAGMCISMKDSPEAKAIFERAEHILGYNILTICLKNDSELGERLKSTEFVQVSLLVSCIAKLEQLKVERPDLSKKITHVAGLSVGEFAALVFAGVIKFEDALKLVQVRGKAMEEEVRQSCTGMVSIFGPECEQLEEFLKEKFPLMKISTYLADNQHTVAGTEEDCNALVESLSCKQKTQMKVIDVRRLRVAGAFHSTYMRPAAAVINPVIESMEFCKPSIPIIMNVNGQAVQDPTVMKGLLCEQLVAPVKWKRSVLTAYESNVRNFIEIAPARVLTSIVKKRISQCKNCDTEYIVI